jgi:hypothetical protein
VQLICSWAAAASAPTTSPEVSKSTNQKE